MKLFDDAAVDRKFRRMQWRMLFATMIGYTLFYFMRKNFSFAMPGLQQDCGISKSMLGNFLFWGGIVYGLSKFVNGIVGDRVGPRKMLCLGLLACTMVNVAFGFVHQIAAMLGNGEQGTGNGSVALVWTFGLLLVLNQFFQGTGLRLNNIRNNGIMSEKYLPEYAPNDGHVFLGYKYTRKVRLPGVTIHFLATPSSLESGYPFLGNLGVSSHARAMLENLEPDKTQGGVAKCLGAEAVEERLEAEFASGGETALNKLRDEARAVANATGHVREFARLERIIGAILSTRPFEGVRRFCADPLGVWFFWPCLPLWPRMRYNVAVNQARGNAIYEKTDAACEDGRGGGRMRIRQDGAG